MPFGFAIGYATVAGVAAALLIGFPALRVKGLFLAVTTLAFAVAARGWLLPYRMFFGDGTVLYLPRGRWLGIDFRSQRAFYYLCLVVLVGCVFITSRLRKSGIGRSIIAVRDNETAAASFTLSPTVAKLTAFAISGGLAAAAGALLAGLRVQFGADSFPPDESLRVVAMTVIGGLGSVSGALLGAIYVVGLPALFDNNATVALLTSGAGLLVLLLYLPGGLAQITTAARDITVRWYTRRLQMTTARDPGTDVLRAPSRPAMPRRERGQDNPALVARQITVSFGGRRAVDDVSLEVNRNEVVGLIGANGAGKSTLMNVIGGFIRPDSGTVEVFGTDVTALSPARRASHGIGRVFQDARLFGDLTVRETVKVALESHERTELVPSLLGLGPSRRAERAKAAEASEFISFLGLGRYADAFLSDLSTGTRRIVELCCLLAQRADLLLLDEPTAGVAQRESEAFGPLIRRVRQELDASILIIEHDIPLIMSISDRVYCLAAGTCIADGHPHDVRRDPAVIAAYLGTDERAIQRSGIAAAAHVTSDRPRDLAALRRDDLIRLAVAAGLRNHSRLRKAELIDLLERSS